MSSNSDLKGHYPDNNKNRDAKKIMPYDVSENFVRVEQIYSEEANERGVSSVLPTEVSETPIFNFDLEFIHDDFGIYG